MFIVLPFMMDFPPLLNVQKKKFVLEMKLVGNIEIGRKNVKPKN